MLIMGGKKKQSSFSNFCPHWWVQLSLDSSCRSRGRFSLLSFNLALRPCWKWSLFRHQWLKGGEHKDVSISGDGTPWPLLRFGLIGWTIFTFFFHSTAYKTNHLTKYWNSQVWPKDGHVDHRVVPQRSPGCGGCLPAGWQAVRRGWIRRPVISEHRRVLRCTEQWVDWGNRPRHIYHSFELLFCCCFRKIANSALENFKLACFCQTLWHLTSGLQLTPFRGNKSAGITEILSTFYSLFSQSRPCNPLICMKQSGIFFFEGVLRWEAAC